MEFVESVEFEVEDSNRKLCQLSLRAVGVDRAFHLIRPESIKDSISIHTLPRLRRDQGLFYFINTIFFEAE